MLVHFKNSIKTTERQCNAREVPYSPELANFLSESRNAQTLYSGSDRFFKKAVFQFHEGNLIEKFIACTMSFHQYNEMTVTLNVEIGVIKKITEKIIQESRKFNCEVCFDVIWIYYYVYRNAGSKSLPLFKIYNGINQNNVIYLDALLKVYNSWNSFLDEAELGEALICVPRNGIYQFDEGVLNLEYVMGKNHQKGFVSERKIRIEPFSKSFALTWVKTVQSWLSNNPVILEKVNNFLNLCKKHNIFSYAIGILVALFEPKLALSHPDLFKYGLEALQIIFTHSNTLGLSEEFRHNCRAFIGFLDEIKSAIFKHWHLLKESAILLQLLREPNKNWSKIMDTLWVLIKEASKMGLTP